MAHRLPLISILSRRRFVQSVLMLFVAMAACFSPARAVMPVNPTVSLVIDYGDGVEKRFTRIPWKKDMTVLDAMKAAQSGPHPIAFEYAHFGGPETYLLTQLDGMKNEGGGAQKRNWLFLVNDAPADKGFGVRTLNPSDTVTWRYAAGLPTSTNPTAPASK